MAPGRESGLSGKRPLPASAVLGLHRPTAGRVLFSTAGDVTPRPVRPCGTGCPGREQSRFVLPGSVSHSLDPPDAVGDSIVLSRCVVHDGLGRGTAPLTRSRIGESLPGNMVRAPGLHPRRYPNEFLRRPAASGSSSPGRARPAAAADRSATRSVVTVLDVLDPVRQILEPAGPGCRTRSGLAYVLLSHDLSVVRHVSDRSGRDVSRAHRRRGRCGHCLRGRPRHPYTEALLSAIPVPDPKRQRARRRQVLQGDLPNPADPPAGCPFVTRCPIREPRCAHDRPRLEIKESGQRAACHFR